MRIKELYLKNFRNVAEDTFVFKASFTVVIGMNGKGKSTLLHALRIAAGAYLLDSKITGIKRRHIIPSEVRQTVNNGVNIEHKPVVVKAKGIFENGQEIAWQRRIVEGSTSTTSSVADVGVIRDLGKSKYVQMLEQGGKASLKLPLLAYLGTDRVHGASRNRLEANRDKREIFKEGYHNWDQLRASTYQYKEWLATYDVLVKNGVEDPKSKQAFFETIKLACPYIKEVEFVVNQLWLSVSFEGEQAPLQRLELHSDGVITFIEMVAELAYRCIVLNAAENQPIEEVIATTSGLVMIDELDIHLHPKWQQRVVQDLKNAFPQLQFVVTTHSPFIIQSVTEDELINLEELGGNLEGLDGNPNNYSVEEVAIQEMGVDAKRSQDFLKRLELLDEYRNLVKQGKSS